ncbi:hypothetical protein PQX77_013164 [Marasmius sp. AFHP31]|nr:hypothetical protein PQX77_013164 [Marasmius sp. AFHP31]
MFLIYGMYTIIFGLCMHVLHRRHTSGLRLYLVCTILLFAFATLYIASETFGETRQAVILFRAAKTREFEPLVRYLNQDNLATVWITISSFVGTFMNALADIMLIHRCYILWESSRIVLYTLGTVGTILNGISLATAFMCSIGDSNVDTLGAVYDTCVAIDRPNSMAIAVFNGLLSLLTAGRIWWVSREARRHIDMPVSARHKAIVAAILESGLLYPTTLLASKILPYILDPKSSGAVPVDFEPIAAMMSGLAPTLIIVRVAYRKSVDSVQQMISIHFAEREFRREDGITLGATMDVRSLHQNDDSASDVRVEETKSEAKNDEGQMV